MVVVVVDMVRKINLLHRLGSFVEAWYLERMPYVQFGVEGR